MAIKNYPSRIYKKTVPSIDRVMAKRNPILTQGAANVFSTALDVTISRDDNWHLDEIGFTFSNTSARTFSALIKNGRRVVTNYNDYLWFHVVGTLPHKIILTSGFYTGTELAAHLQARLNASYASDGITFTVVYNDATGIYTVTPSSSTIKYLETNYAQGLPYRDSIAGHLFGLNENTTAFSANVSSDTAVFGLDSEVSIINQTNSTATSYLHDTIHIMSIDQSLHLTSNAGSDVTIAYTVLHEDMV